MPRALEKVSQRIKAEKVSQRIKVSSVIEHERPRRRTTMSPRRREPAAAAVLAALPFTTLVVNTDAEIIQAISGSDPVIAVDDARGRRLCEVLGVEDDGLDGARWQMWLACALGHDLTMWRLYAGDAPRTVAASGARPALALDIGPLVEDDVVIAAMITVRRDESMSAVPAPAPAPSSLAPGVVTDIRGALDDCDAELEKLSRDPGARHALHRLFRAVHSLKALAGAAGLAEVAVRAHRIEDRLQQLRVSTTEPGMAELAALRANVGELRVALAVGASDTGPDAMTLLYAACRPLLPRIERAAAAWSSQPRRADRARRLERLLAGFGEAVSRARCDLFATRVSALRDAVTAARASARPSRRDLAAIEQGVDEVSLWLGQYHELHLEVRASDATGDVAGMLTALLRPDDADVDLAGLGVVARAAGALSLAATLAAPGGTRRAVAAVRDLPAMLTPAQPGAERADAARELDAAHEALVRSLAGTHALDRFHRELERLGAAVAGVTWAPLDDIAARVAAVATMAATETDKQVEIEMDVVGLRLPSDVRQALSEVLVHAVRNAVDHGIESAADRVAAGKSPLGQIAVVLDVDDRHLLVEIRDDGAGIDLDRVRRRGEALGVLTDPDASATELLELLFEPGFSTASAVTSLSGRGVGMDAIRTLARARGGNAELRSSAGKGTVLVVELGLTSRDDATR